MEILKPSDHAGRPHIQFGLSIEIVYQTLCDLISQPCQGRRLEERQTVKPVVLVVQHDVACHRRVVTQPGNDLIAPRLIGEVGRDVDEWNAPVPCAEQTCRIVAPCRGQDDFRLRTLQDPTQPLYEERIRNIRKLTWIGCALAVQNPIDIRKDDLHDDQPGVMSARCRKAEVSWNFEPRTPLKPQQQAASFERSWPTTAPLNLLFPSTEHCGSPRWTWRRTIQN